MKFKQHVDAHISAGLHSVFGIPSLVTQGFNLNYNGGPMAQGPSYSRSSRDRLGASPEDAEARSMRSGKSGSQP